MSTSDKTAVRFQKLPSEERGKANHGWLKTFHTFSFADYSDARFNNFGCLRVINEDRVEPQTGFGTHPHREFEIFSYVVSGELQHNDSLGNKEILKRGDLQMTSTGTGIRHSEHTHGPKQVHFLQIWALPSQRGLKPQYYTRHFTDAEKRNKWAHIVAPFDSSSSYVSLDREAPGPAPVHAPLSLYATLLSPATSLSYTFTGTASSTSDQGKEEEKEQERKMYVHVVQTSGYNTGAAGGNTVRIISTQEAGGDGDGGEETGKGKGEVALREGDGAFVWGRVGCEVRVENVGEGVAEVLLFEMD
ncbi:pirin domain-containing protein [Stereum hirsutum FP-91666 SS1]|uniref:pirin domain-containing protein n=1 Tax=Stereum hirsutum (strain FP-91666) TaxID=721885 RepID=UPI000440C0DD|nr:pirin domain-containing protein [Stereum hirsutum FP-91666 SS1]EIM86476.1 pirin domain-containing protein [Stereum hirsutum FP-91666 SS1]